MARSAGSEVLAVSRSDSGATPVTHSPATPVKIAAMAEAASRPVRPTPSGIAFRLLGPLELSAGGRAVAISASRARVVLAMLLLERNRIMPVHRLLTAVWEDNPPPTCKGQIQICVSALRRQLAELGVPAAIETCSPGYRLIVEDRWIDLPRFDLLAETGRQAIDQGALPAGRSALAQALELWRGPALCGVDSAIVQAVAGGLTERRLAVFETFVDLELRLGNGSAVLGAISDFVAEYPMLERLRVQQMKALYWSGRQAEALQVYRDARRYLIDELGVEPGRELRALEQAILHDDETDELLRIMAPPQQLIVRERPTDGTAQRAMVDCPELVGRSAELADARAALAGMARTVVISGMPGVGKTYLGRAVAAGCGAGLRQGSLLVELGERTPIGKARLGSRLAAELDPEPGQQPSGDGWPARLAGAQAVFLLDDVAPGEDLRWLPAAAPHCAFVVTCTGQPVVSEPANRIVLGCLELDDALTLLGAHSDPDRIRFEPTSAIDLVNGAGRHPAAIVQLAGRLSQSPVSISALLERTADPVLESREDRQQYLIGKRLDESFSRLDVAAQSLGRLLSLHAGQSWPGWTAAALLDVAPASAEPVLQRLVAADLVQPDGDDRYRLHPLLHDYLKQRLARDEHPARREAAERRLLAGWSQVLGQVLLTSGYAGLLLDQPASAAGWSAAGDLADLTDPAGWPGREWDGLEAAAVRAADLAAAGACWRIGYYLAMLGTGFAFGLPSVRLRPERLAGLTRLAERAAVRAGDRLGEAAMLHAAGLASLAGEDHRTAAVQLTAAERLSGELGEPYTAAAAALASAELLLARGEPAAEQRFGSVLAGFEELGDLAGQLHALLGLARAQLAAGRPGEARQSQHRAHRLAEELGSQPLRDLVRRNSAGRLGPPARASRRLFPAEPGQLRIPGVTDKPVKAFE
ncbi:MAG: BTAD domain-containing putative transcriptional regulator [Jatrophihabitantaceae bacterium]